ncbi:MAG: NUDIX domain-containing protein [Candidatus Aenigmarchaeota archaeon]|nr:NUDIX domain-containing protein [Candidatus Aenigmarchaeota archaeon]
MAETTRHFISRVYPVKDGKVLLIKGKTGHWLPPGGHIEMDELPTQAAVREVREETGYKIALRGQKRKFQSAHVLPPADHVEVHDVEENHQHIAFIYFAEIEDDPKTPNPKGNREVKWFTPEELESTPMKDSVKYFAGKAIRELSPKPEPVEPAPVVTEDKSLISKVRKVGKKIKKKIRKSDADKTPEELLDDQKKELEKKGPEEGTTESEETPPEEQ